MLSVASRAMELPPIPVAEKITFDAVASNSIRNHLPVVSETLYAPEVDVNPATLLMPLTRICPCDVNAIPAARLEMDPPMRLANSITPVGLNLATKLRVSVDPVGAVPSEVAPATAKLGFDVAPVTYKSQLCGGRRH